ncbi:MAG: hypothetical protein K0S93_35 [Nitrososphaeraceae archaeon]|jgi:hypothetical protein|nr:hypothetical protein [Nitrososphaeraceae archaeon]
MNKWEAMRIIQYKLGIDDLLDESNFFTVYYNLGKKKDLAYCNSADEALDFIHKKLTDDHKIAIEYDDFFLKSEKQVDRYNEKGWEY